MRDLEEKIQENSFRAAEPAAERSEGDGAEAPEEQQLTQSSAITPDNKHSDPLREEDSLSKECKSLQELVQKLEEKNANLQVRVMLTHQKTSLHHLWHETKAKENGIIFFIDNQIYAQ